MNFFTFPKTPVEIGVATGSGIALTTYQDRLVAAFKSCNDLNILTVFYSHDGINWHPINSDGNTGLYTDMTPALAVFNDEVYCAFRANDSSYRVLLASSSDGHTWTLINGNGSTGAVTGSGLALAAFNGKLYCAFKSCNDQNTLIIMSSSDGNTWTLINGNGNTGQTTPETPAIAVFDGKLYCAFKSNNPTYQLLMMSSSDGENWELINGNGITLQATGSGPSLTVANATLYCAYKSCNDQNNLMMISSSDGSHWSLVHSTGLTHQQTPETPGLATLHDQFFCAFKANDATHSALLTYAQEPNWMEKNLSMLGNRTLREICLPGSHDAGMSKLASGTFFAHTCNVVTQSSPIGDQLAFGARYFDIRPVISAGKYLTGHYNDTGTAPLNWQGGNGESIDSIIESVNAFVTEYKELVILKISQDLNTDVGNSAYRGFNQEEYNAFMAKLVGLTNLYINNYPTTDLTQIPLNILLSNGSCGTVLVIVDPKTPDISLGSYAQRGIYPMSSFPLIDEYSDKNEPLPMIQDQIQKMIANKKNSCYFLLSWTLTQSNEQAATCFTNPPFFVRWFIDEVLSILQLSDKANPLLYNNEALLQACTPNCFPNILYVDNVSPSIGLVEMALTINTNYDGQS